MGQLENWIHPESVVAREKPGCFPRMPLTKAYYTRRSNDLLYYIKKANMLCGIRQSSIMDVIENNGFLWFVFASRHWERCQCTSRMAKLYTHRNIDFIIQSFELWCIIFPYHPILPTSKKSIFTSEYVFTSMCSTCLGGGFNTFEKH